MSTKRTSSTIDADTKPSKKVATKASKTPEKTNGSSFDIISAAQKSRASVSQFYLESFFSSCKHKYTLQYITEFAEHLTDDSRATLFWGETIVGKSAWIASTSKMMEHCPIYDDCKILELSNEVIFSSDDHCALEVKETYQMDQTTKMTTLAFCVYKKDANGPFGVKCLYYQETKDEALSTKMPEMPVEFNLIEAAKKQIKEMRDFYQGSMHEETRTKYTKEYVTKFSEFLSEKCHFNYFWGGSNTSREEWIEDTMKMREGPTFKNPHAEQVSSHVVFATEDRCMLEIKETYHLGEDNRLTCVGLFVFIKDEKGPNGVRCTYYQETKDEANSNFKFD